jgi:peptidoglycan/xylan/chitin deacetylase (PgdA/CDA1 family)
MQDMEKMKDVFSFGAHTHALHNRKDAHTSGLLTQLPYHEVVADLKLNRKKLPTPSPYFAYPYGNLNETGIRAVRDAGFKLAPTTQEGRVFPGDNPLILDRKGIYPNMDMEDFKNIFATLN